MELSFKKVLAGLSAAAITLTQVGSAVAAYSDVPAGVWYGEAVEAFVDAGYLDATQTRFRGGDLANRAELVKLVVEMNGGILSTPPATSSFRDVKPSDWFYGYMHEAAKEGWVKGDGNCYGQDVCYARPAANVNRAEAAAIIVRAFALEATGEAEQFADNPSGQWFTDVIQTAADHCVLQGDDSSGRVRPSDNMNRAEMVVMLHRVDQGLTYGVDCGPQPEEASVDGATATSLQTVEVEFSVALDQDSAEDTANYTVSGNDELTVTAAELVEDTVVKLTVDGDLDADADYTVTVSGVMSADGEEVSGSATFSGYSERVQGDGSLDVSLASVNPVSDTVPKAANGVTMLSIDVMAGDDDVVIDDMTILHEGFGATTDLDGVYVAEDGARLSRKRVFDSQNQTAQVRFITPLVVKKGETRTLDLLVDFNSTATTAAEHNLVVELPSDITSNAKSVDGNFPLRGNTFRVAAITSGKLTATYRNVTPNSVNVGKTEAVLGRFELSANSVEDQTVYTMTVTQDGTATDGDVTNLKLRRADGTVISNTVPAFEGDVATFTFNPPFTVKQGDRLVVEVVGDVVGGAAKTVKLSFEETSDIFAVGSLYGYGVNGQLYGSQITLSGTATSVTLDAGEFTLEIDGPVQQSYTRDTDDAVLANVKFNLGGGDDVNIKKMFVLVHAQNSTGAALSTSNSTSYDEITEVLENVRLRNTKTGNSITATAVSGAKGTGASTAGSYQIYQFDDITIKDDSTYELRIDFINNGAANSPKSGDQFKVHVCNQPTDTGAGSNSTYCSFGGVLQANTTTSNVYQMEIEGLSTGDPVTDVRPLGTVSGNFHRIASSSLTVAAKAIGTSDTAVKNSKNINLYRFEARAGEAEDIMLTQLIFDSNSGSLNNAQNYSLWADEDGDSKVDTLLQGGVANQSSKITFNDMKDGGYVLEKEKTVAFEVHGDVASTLTNDDLSIKLATGESDYVEAVEYDTRTSLSGIKTNTTCSSSPCEITVTTTGVTSKNYFLTNQGNLYVTGETKDIRNSQLLGGALAPAALRLRFRGEFEDIDVTDLQINSSGSTATSVDRLELYKEGAATSFASATVGACGSDDTLHTNPNGGAGSTQAFCAQLDGRQLVVPKGQEVDVLVRPRLKNDQTGALSAEILQFFVESQAVSNNTTGSGAVRARGDQSSNNLSANSGDSSANGEVFIGRSSANATNAKINGLKHVSVLSKVASIVDSNPASSTTAAMPNGTSEIARYKITAAAHDNSLNGLNKFTLSGVIFNVTATNVNLDGTAFVLYNTANSAVTGSCTAMTTAGASIGTASGAFLVRCPNLIAGTTVDTAIDQGAYAEFSLRGTITNPNTATSGAASTLQVELKNFSTSTYTTFGPATTASHFSWVDKDNASSCARPNVAGTTTCGEFLWIDIQDTSVKSATYRG